jgi:RNA polymerase sigma factor (sigma-70 family)
MMKGASMYNDNKPNLTVMNGSGINTNAMKALHAKGSSRSLAEIAHALEYEPTCEFIICPERVAEMLVGHPKKEALVRAEIYNVLHERCYSRVYGFLRRSVSTADAEELTQETFLRVFSRENLETMSISISYLFRVAQNLVRRRYSRAQRERAFLDRVRRQSEALEHDRQQPRSRIDSFESSHLKRALKLLNDRDNEIIHLIVCEGRSYVEVSRLKNVPVTTINNWKHRALRRLRKVLNELDSAASPTAPNSTQRVTHDHTTDVRDQAGRIEHEQHEQSDRLRSA